MVFVTWNCNGSLRKKLQPLSDLAADVAVIQECEDPARSTDAHYKSWAANYLWTGPNKNRGLGVFAKPHIQLELASLDPGTLQLFLPCWINKAILLVAVWTKQASSPNFRYIGQLWKYLQLYRSAVASFPSVVAGDFNSNTIWDESDRWWNHSDVVKQLEASGLASVYHQNKRLAHGKEIDPTYYMYRKEEKAYHIDYIFVPRAWLPNCDLEIGPPSRWLHFSDHSPVRVNIKLVP
jgi:exonuclease III